MLFPLLRMPSSLLHLVNSSCYGHLQWSPCLLTPLWFFHAESLSHVLARSLAGLAHCTVTTCFHACSLYLVSKQGRGDLQLILGSQCSTQCLVHGGFLINVCWMWEWPSYNFFTARNEFSWWHVVCRFWSFWSMIYNMVIFKCRLYKTTFN